MANLDLPPGLLPTLKDRLLDPDSMGTRDVPGYTLEQILESVREDIEELLNTRTGLHKLETDFPEVARSIVTYGLPDLSSIDTSTPGKRENLGRVLERIIALHEPRLRNIRASMDAPRANELSATFKIDAELCVDPAPPVAFETVVQLTTGYIAIREGTA
jgi:type VI secretion system protein ImpF